MKYDIETRFNFAQFPGNPAKGHYESFFVRANHPDEAKALWIRYTAFIPGGRPADAIGELWGAWFEGKSHAALKQEMALADLKFSPEAFRIESPAARMDERGLKGRLESARGRMEWDLVFSGKPEPLFLFPRSLYNKPLPKAKSLTGMPLIRLNGQFSVNGKTMQVKNWPGSQSHNWGSKHTDRYAWGQVCGFDNSPDTFLELATAQLKFGPVWTPAMTPVVLRHGGRDYELNPLLHLTGRASYRFFDWEYRAAGQGISIQGRITSKKDDFVCLRYLNPPGGFKYCLNSKIASCELQITADSGKREELVSRNRAAFEILTDDESHGLVPLA